MALTVDGIFSAMAGSFLPEKAQGVNASAAYKITGEGGGDYTSVVKDGQFTLLREAKADANVTVTISSADWIALNEGTLDPMSAYMSGKLKATGDLALLQKFPRLFKRASVKPNSGIPMAELVPMRLAKLNQAMKVILGDQSFGSGPELRGEEVALRGLIEGQLEPGPALLGGQLVFAGDMGVLRGAWTTWSASPVAPKKRKKPGVMQLAGMWLKGLFSR